MGIVWIDSAIIRRSVWDPAQTTDAENEEDREGCEKKNSSKNVDGLNEHKHRSPLSAKM